MLSFQLTSLELLSKSKNWSLMFELSALNFGEGAAVGAIEGPEEPATEYAREALLSVLLPMA